MADAPAATPLRICPHLTSATVKVSSIVGADGKGNGEVVLTPVQCMGPACQYWLHDAGLPPNTGDCGVMLGALFGATSATQIGNGNTVLVELNQNIATLGAMLNNALAKAGLIPAPTQTPSV
jgi:hypothetical protein